MKKRPWNDGGAETRFWVGRLQAPVPAGEILGLFFGSQDPKNKNVKNAIKNYNKNEHPNIRNYFSESHSGLVARNDR